MFIIFIPSFYNKKTQMKHIRLIPNTLGKLLKGIAFSIQKITDQGGYSGSENNDENSQILDEELMAPEDIQKKIEIDSASGGKRLANLIIDRIVLYLFFVVLGVVIGIFSPDTMNTVIEQENTPAFKIIDFFISIMVGLTYYIGFEAATGRTIGKYVTGTKVVDNYGKKPDTSTIIARSLCRLIPFNAFSFLNSKSSGWHDSISKTRVVNVKSFYDE
jgi:uncharacterized RDD family membrane protein YckC